VQGLDVVLGHPWQEDARRIYAMSWIRDGRLLGRYLKHSLPI
jgi:hypothetical protein